MARYLLQDLIFVREHREDKASKAVTLARRIVREKEQAVVAKKKELEDYNVWRLAEEERLFNSIMLKPVKLGDITDLRLEIAGMREKELNIMDEVQKAEGELDQARVALEEARKAHMKATQELEKLVAHREIWKSEQALEEERLADLELEDFTRLRNPLGGSNPTQQSYEYN